MKRFLYNLFVANYRVKIAALVLAAGVWLYFQTTSTESQEVSATLRLRPPAGFVVLVSADNGWKVLADEPMDLRLKIKGSRAALMRLGTLQGSYSLEAYVKTLPSQGAQTVSVKLQPAFFGLGGGFSIVEPQEIVVTLDRLVTRTLKVEPQIIGHEQLPPGYELSEPTWVPQQVDVSGPSSVLAGAEKAVTTPGIPVTRSLYLHPELSVERRAVTVGGLELPIKESVLVTLRAVPKRQRRTIEGVFLSILEPADAAGTRVVDVSDESGRPVRTVVVEVEGPPETVEGIRASELLATLDLLAMPASSSGWEGKLPVRVERLPAGVRLVQVQPDRVSVRTRPHSSQ